MNKMSIVIQMKRQVILKENMAATAQLGKQIKLKMFWVIIVIFRIIYPKMRCIDINIRQAAFILLTFLANNIQTGRKQTQTDLTYINIKWIYSG